jgi:cation transport ATPase
LNVVGVEGFTKDNINNDLMMELNQTLSKGGLRLLVIDHTKFNHVDKRVVVVEKKEEREEEREEKKRESKEGGDQGKEKKKVQKQKNHCPYVPIRHVSSLSKLSSLYQSQSLQEKEEEEEKEKDAHHHHSLQSVPHQNQHIYHQLARAPSLGLLWPPKHDEKLMRMFGMVKPVTRLLWWWSHATPVVFWCGYDVYVEAAKKYRYTYDSRELGAETIPCGQTLTEMMARMRELRQMKKEARRTLIARGLEGAAKHLPRPVAVDLVKLLLP